MSVLIENYKKTPLISIKSKQSCHTQNVIFSSTVFSIFTAIFDTLPNVHTL